jgi:hypothetical protein
MRFDEQGLGQIRLGRQNRRIEALDVTDLNDAVGAACRVEDPLRARPWGRR